MIDLVIGALATWRLTHLVLYERGPFNILTRTRAKLGVIYDMQGRLVGYKYELTVCIWCLSIWVGAAIATGYFILGDKLRWFLLPYVFSAVACILGKQSDASSNP